MPWKCSLYAKIDGIYVQNLHMSKVIYQFSFYITIIIEIISRGLIG